MLIGKRERVLKSERGIWLTVFLFAKLFFLSSFLSLSSRLSLPSSIEKKVKSKKKNSALLCVEMLREKEEKNKSSECKKGSDSAI